jgi:hypothetical protein
VGEGWREEPYCPLEAGPVTTSETASGRVANPRPLAVPGVVGVVGPDFGRHVGDEREPTALANSQEGAEERMAESQVLTFSEKAGEFFGEGPRDSALSVPNNICAHCGGRYVLDEGDLKCFACGRSPDMGDIRRAALMAEMDELRNGKLRIRQPIPGGVWRDEPRQLELIAS